MVQNVPAASIVIPAHNEQLGLARLLPQLLGEAMPGEFHVIVVCNGCTDASASTAAGFGPAVDVIERDEASKAAALVAGAQRVSTFPIIYIDADVVIDTASIRALISALETQKYLAAGPERHLDRSGVSFPAGWYYDVWELLPNVRSGLFGRGVIALSAAGYNRIDVLPRYLSDDLAFSEAFSAQERTIVADARVTVWPARTWRALLRRRTRVATGVRELQHDNALSSSAETKLSDVFAIVRERPTFALKSALFLATAVAARFAARRSRHNGVSWQRDETSRVAR